MGGAFGLLGRTFRAPSPLAASLVQFVSAWFMLRLPLVREFAEQIGRIPAMAPSAASVRRWTLDRRDTSGAPGMERWKR